MYQFGAEQTVTGDIDAFWAVWTDLPRFPTWDPREEETRIDGPFEVGTTTWSKQRGNPGGPATIVDVDKPRKWTVESSLPGGKLVIDHLLEEVEPGRVRVSKRYEVHGPLTVLFRLYYGPRVRKALPRTFSALEAEARSPA